MVEASPKRRRAAPTSSPCSCDLTLDDVGRTMAVTFYFRPEPDDFVARGDTGDETTTEA